jgi:hypothetical protein
MESQNCSWPFVTLEAFEERHLLFAQKDQADEVAVIPLVSQDERLEWEDYSVANQGWVQEGVNFRTETSSI